MNLENIQKVENLIKERNSIIKFRDESSENNKDRTLSFEEVEFTSDFMRPIYGEEFIKDVKKTVLKLCNDYITKIDDQLSEL